MNETSDNAGLATSLRVNSEAIEAQPASKFCDDFAVGDVLELNNRDARAYPEDTVGLTGQTVVVAVVVDTIWKRRDAFSIDEVEIFGADFASPASFLDASVDLDVFADASRGIGLKSSRTLRAFALGVKGEAAILTVLRGVEALSVAELVI